MQILHRNPFRRQYQRSQALRAAVLATFSQTPHSLRHTLGTFTERDWRANLYWLDASGLALYLLDHLQQHGQECILPASILQRLQQNLAENTLRNLDLLEETIDINRSLLREGVFFTNLKGITLSPESVPNPALRLRQRRDPGVQVRTVPISQAQRPL